MAQLYVSNLTASVPVPIRRLAGFERIHLKEGQTKTVTFNLTPRQLSLIDDEGKRIIEPGEFQVAVSGHQPGIIPADEDKALIASFEVI